MFSGKGNSRSISKLPFETAAAYLVQIGIDKIQDFKLMVKNRELPPVIPRDPDAFYEEYIGWRDFMDVGKNYIAENGEFTLVLPTYKALKKRVVELEIVTKKEYKESVKSGVLGDLAPLHPDKAFLDEFEGWSLFLVRYKSDKYLSFEQVRQFARDMDIKSSTQWVEMCRKGQRPANIPAWPERHYRDKWMGWMNFLKR